MKSGRYACRGRVTSASAILSFAALAGCAGGNEVPIQQSSGTESGTIAPSSGRASGSSGASASTSGDATGSGATSGNPFASGSFGGGSGGFSSGSTSTSGSFVSSGSVANTGADASTAPQSGLSPGIPCAVEALLINQCQSCHGVDPVLPAPNSLVTKSDLTSLSLPEPTKTNAEESLARIQNTLYPMPPAPAPPPSDDAIAALKSWIAAGYPDQTCAELPDAGDVADATLGGSGYDGPFTCSTGKTYTGGNDPLMRPGDPCQYCHTFPAAGTVYKTEHEDESCEGANVSNANIVITDANGMVLTLPVNSAGNFYTGTTIAGPFHAKLVYAGGERDMLEAQSSGNCNLCHTPAGDNGAPGRIMLP